RRRSGRGGAGAGSAFDVAPGCVARQASLAAPGLSGVAVSDDRDRGEPVVVARRRQAGMSFAAHLLERRHHADVRVECPRDRLTFRPVYTDGVCPLCGWRPPDVDATPPLSVRIDRFWLAV